MSTKSRQLARSAMCPRAFQSWRRTAAPNPPTASSRWNGCWTFSKNAGRKSGCSGWRKSRNPGVKKRSAPAAQNANWSKASAAAVKRRSSGGGSRRSARRACVFVCLKWSGGFLRRSRIPLRGLIPPGTRPGTPPDRLLPQAGPDDRWECHPERRECSAAPLDHVRQKRTVEAHGREEIQIEFRLPKFVGDDSYLTKESAAFQTSNGPSLP
jgi:hypothetical protein